MKQPLPLPLRVSDLAVGGGTEVGSEPELIWLIAVTLLLATIMILQTTKVVCMKQTKMIWGAQLRW